MWNRADLKANAKKIFFGNYWKAVLVTLIFDNYSWWCNKHNNKKNFK